LFLANATMIVVVKMRMEINQTKEYNMKKKIPAGKKGKGIRMLKKKAPQVAKRMGYKKGSMKYGK